MVCESTTAIECSELKVPDIKIREILSRYMEFTPRKVKMILT